VAAIRPQRKLFARRAGGQARVQAMESPYMTITWRDPSDEALVPISSMFLALAATRREAMGSEWVANHYATQKRAENAHRCARADRALRTPRPAGWGRL
jgi:hypothetical protein